MKTICAIVLATSLFGLSCGAGGMDERGSLESDSGWYPGSEEDGVSAPDWAEYTPPPPEQELEFDFQAPQASEHYVYIAATARDSLVRIGAEEPPTIKLIPVGGRPTRVATLPAGDTALCINSGTDDFSIIRSTEDEDEVTTLDIIPYTNTISVSPDGKYALVYYSDKAAAADDPVGDFQTTGVVRTEPDGEKVIIISTGFHPTAVYFHESKPIAYMVTDDGISVVELNKAKNGDITNIIAVSDDPLDQPGDREVLVTPDGKYAVVRSLTKQQVTVVELAKDLRASVEIQGLPTDVDLVPGQHLALLVLREQKLAYVVDLKKVMDAEKDAAVPIDISETQAGAAVVTRDGSRAVLYTTVGAVKAVAMMDLTTPEYSIDVYAVQKRVLGVNVSQAGTSAVIYHELDPVDQAMTSLEKTIAQSEGFTLFNLDTGFRKLIQTGHRWSDSLFVAKEDGSDFQVYVLTPGDADGTHVVYSVDLKTCIATPIDLASYPTSMVFVPLSRKVAVAQEHVTGRLTFIDVDSHETWSVTGYELNGLIH